MIVGNEVPASGKDGSSAKEAEVGVAVATTDVDVGVGVPVGVAVGVGVAVPHRQSISAVQLGFLQTPNDPNSGGLVGAT